MTDAERRLWAALRNRRLADLKFRRQVPLGRYVLDFYCEDARLAVEVDGSQHAQRVAYDEARTLWLASKRIRTVRVWNNDVIQNLAGVLEIIASAADAAPHPLADARRPLPQGEG